MTSCFGVILNIEPEKIDLAATETAVDMYLLYCMLQLAGSILIFNLKPDL